MTVHLISHACLLILPPLPLHRKSRAKQRNQSRPDTMHNVASLNDIYKRQQLQHCCNLLITRAHPYHQPKLSTLATQRAYGQRLRYILLFNRHSMLFTCIKLIEMPVSLFAHSNWCIWRKYSYGAYHIGNSVNQVKLLLIFSDSLLCFGVQQMLWFQPNCKFDNSKLLKDLLSRLLKWRTLGWGYFCFLQAYLVDDEFHAYVDAVEKVWQEIEGDVLDNPEADWFANRLNQP